MLLDVVLLRSLSRNVRRGIVAAQIERGDKLCRRNNTPPSWATSGIKEQRLRLLLLLRWQPSLSLSSFATPDELQRFLREQSDTAAASQANEPSHQRVWRVTAPPPSSSSSPPSPPPGKTARDRQGSDDASGPTSHHRRDRASSSSSPPAASAASSLPSSPAAAAANVVEMSVWRERVADRQSTSLSDIVQRISAQESRGGRLRLRQHGVLHDDPATDMEMLTQNYTVAAVASALRDREDSLQMAAVLASEERWDELKQMLSIFHPKYVLQRRSQIRQLDVTAALNSHSLEVIRKALMRMPRTVTQAHSRRAGVVLALCSVEGVPCLLLEKRSANIRAHPDEVCLPGGMVCKMNDRSIIATCLREMREEIGGLAHRNVQVLGVLRCNWGEVHHLVGVAVTPVVCFLGELPDRLVPDQREVAEVFTIPLASLLDKSLWVYKEGLAPIFLGGPHVIWGLTGYILDRFCKDILLPNSRSPSDVVI